jgi:hypothetical protein
MVMLTFQVMQGSLSKFINTVFTAQMSGEKLSPTMIADKLSIPESGAGNENNPWTKFLN